MRRVVTAGMAFVLMLVALVGCTVGYERRDWRGERDPARGITQGVAHDRDGGLEERR